MLPVCTSAWLASSRITPSLLLKPVACRLPALLTTPPCKLSAACADRMISPPGACTALPFCTSAAIVAGVTTTWARPLLALNCKLKLSPAASTAVPICAMTMPLLMTLGASRAM